MAAPTQNMLTEAIAAARAGDRVRARDLFTRLLRTDSGSAEYWVWMSSVVDSKRERIYCLESALKLDPTNRAALRGLTILGARSPQEAELASAVRIPRRQVASIASGQATVGRLGLRINWKFAAAGASGLTILAIIVLIATTVLRGRRPLSVAPTLPPPFTETSIPTPETPTATVTPLPASIRIQRTAVPTEYALTPLAMLVPKSPTPTIMLGVTPHPNYEAYSSSLSALSRGDFEAALRFIQNVIDLDASLPDAHYHKGEALRLRASSDQTLAPNERSKLLVDALNAYDQAILRDPDFAPAYLGRGRVLLERELVTTKVEDLKLDDLPDDFNRAIALDPGLVEPYIEKAKFLATIRLWKTMEDFLQSAINNSVHTPTMYILLAKAQFNRERYQEALENVVTGSADDPTDLAGYLILGQVHARLGEYDAALWPLMTYVVYRPDDPNGWAELGRAQLETGDLVSAADSIGRALEINDRAPLAYLARGFLHLESGDYEASLADFGLAQRYGRETFDLFLGIGRADFMLGRSKDALDNANVALEIANQIPEKGIRERNVAEGYALRALIAEANPDPEMQDYAVLNWTWILQLEFADSETREMAENHLKELIGGTPTPSHSETPSPTPRGTTPTTSAGTGTPSPTRTPTPSPTQTPP